MSCVTRGVKISYYACRKRLDTKDCDQDYVRTDWIEDKIMDEVQTVFQGKALLESIWASAQKKLAAVKTDFLQEVLSNLRAVVEAVRKYISLTIVT